MNNRQNAYRKSALRKIKPQPQPAPVSTLPMTTDLLTVAEVATILRVDGTTIRRWVKAGAMEAVILPHPNERQAYRIKRSTLNTILGKVEHAK